MLVLKFTVLVAYLDINMYDGLLDFDQRLLFL